MKNQEVGEMGTLFIRQFPRDLKAALKARAAMEQKSLYELVVELLRAQTKGGKK